jgi:ADP-ribosylglycohydrolase
MVPTSMTIGITDRIVACLQGIAVGDAVGKQTEGLSRDGVQRWYPNGVRGFEGLPGAVIPRYAATSKRRWRIGETTDDTERTLAVARAILAARHVSHIGIGREMLGCVKSVHPGVTSLWEFHQAADPARVAAGHDGCGAATRVAPVGVLHSSNSLHELVNDAREASISTHAGTLAVAAAAATAAGVSAAIDAAPADRVRAIAERAAAMAQGRWPSPSAPWFAAAVRTVHDELAALPVLGADNVAARCFPDGPLTIVPLALALATLMRSAEDAILLAANVGGDSDSVASIAGGILGAMYPATVNQQWREVVERVSRHDVAAIARELATLRH